MDAVYRPKTPSAPPMDGDGELGGAENGEGDAMWTVKEPSAPLLPTRAQSAAAPRSSMATMGISPGGVEEHPTQRFEIEAHPVQIRQTPPAAPAAGDSHADGETAALLVSSGDGLWRGYLRNMHCLGTVLTLVVLISALLSPHVLITIFCLVIYFVEVFSSSTFGYLRHEFRLSESAYDYFDTVTRNHAYLRWIVTCYHWERRRQVVANGGRNERTKQHWERVVSHTAQTDWAVPGSEDASLDPASFMLERWDIVAITTNTSHSFADAGTQARHDADMAQFRASNNFDTHQDFSETLVVPDVRKRALCLTHEDAARPWWMCMTIYIVASALLLSVPYRIMFAAATHEIVWRVHKIMSLDPHASGAPLDGTAGTVSGVPTTRANFAGDGVAAPPIADAISYSTVQGSHDQGAREGQPPFARDEDEENVGAENGIISSRE